jgi:hypothetical protein
MRRAVFRGMASGGALPWSAAPRQGARGIVAINYTQMGGSEPPIRRLKVNWPIRLHGSVRSICGTGQHRYQKGPIVRKLL